MFSKGDIIALDFELPHNGDYIEHPAVIISSRNVYKADKVYICVMMTSNKKRDVFSFPVNDNMLESPGNKPDSQVRCHLITYVLEKHIKTKNGLRYNRLNTLTLERLMAQINEIVFES